MAWDYWQRLFHVEIEIASRDAIIFVFIFAFERRQLFFHSRRDRRCDLSSI